MPVLLHGGHEFSLTTWHFDFSLLGGLLIAGGLYVYALASRPAGTRVDWLRAFSFVAGALAIFLALASPLDVAADRLLSMHMLQHVVLTTIGPPLVLLGLPAQAAERLFGVEPIGAVGRVVTNPLIAGALFIVNMWLWHAPPLYGAALECLSVHIVMHLAFLGTGFLFWWPIVQPSPNLAPISAGGRLLYIFVTGFPMAVLALLLLASSSVVYDFYETTPGLWGISPIADQQIAGLIMGALGEAASFIAFSLLFVRYLVQEDKSADERLARSPIDAV
jgi:putative membrane protein